jgi:uncharacterized protein YjbJ (UPF0337 family)
MAKSSRRSQREGALDRVTGRVRATFGKLTGRKAQKATRKTRWTPGSTRPGKVRAGRGPR